MVKIYTVGKVMVALSYALGSFEKYLFYFIQSKSVEYLLEPVYVVFKTLPSVHTVKSLNFGDHDFV